MRIALVLTICIGWMSTVAAQQANNGLFVVPTAYTLPKGTHSVSSYELVFLQYSYSPTSTTHFSAFSMFPFTADVFTETFAIGVKQQVYNKGGIALAGTVSFLPKSEVLSFLGLASLGSEEGAIHVGLGRGGTVPFEDTGFLIMLGLSRKTSEKMSFLAEFISSSDAIDTDFKGLLSGGARYRTRDGFTIDFGLMRPVTTVDMGGFLAIPILKATFEF